MNSFQLVGNLIIKSLNHPNVSPCKVSQDLSKGKCEVCIKKKETERYKDLIFKKHLLFMKKFNERNILKLFAKIVANNL